MKKRTFLVFVFLLFACLYVPTLASQPGDENDPLVTRSYVENRLAQIQIEIAMLRNEIAALNPNAVSSFPQDTQQTTVVAAERDIFQVINMQAGQIITFEASAEFILRSGSGMAVTGVNGIIDITAGVDVLNGETIALHHMMMIPVTDGRGVFFHTEAWMMVRGGYTIIE